MPNFDTCVAKYGEFGVQALIERMERYEGIRANMGLSLEDRWNALMTAQPQPVPSFTCAIAA